MEDSGFLGTLDRLLELLGAHAWLSEVIVTMTDAGGPYNLGGSATMILIYIESVLMDSLGCVSP